MIHPLLIPNINKKIHQILDTLSLRPSVSPEEFIQNTHGIKHRYYSSCIDKKGNKFFISILAHSDLESRNKMLREINFASLTFNSRDKLNLYIPEYLKISDKRNHILWILSEFIPYLSLEKIGQNETLSHQLKLKNIKEISKAIYYLNNNFLKLHEFNLAVPLFNNKQEVEDTVHQYLPNLIKENLITNNIAEKIKEFITDNVDLLSREGHYFVHGDFHLGNVIQYNTDNIIHTKIIDWELYHKCNLSYDIAFLFIKSFHEKSFRKQAVIEFFKLASNNQSSKLKILFRINVLYFIMRFGNEATLPNLSKLELAARKKGFEERKDWFSNLIINSLKGFEQIIKT